MNKLHIDQHTLSRLQKVWDDFYFNKHFNELEIRIGSIKNGKFDSQITNEQFKKFLQNQQSSNIVLEESIVELWNKTLDLGKFTDRDQWIRKITNISDNTISYQTKQKLTNENVNFRDCTYRVASANENHVSESYFERYSQALKMKRDRKRHILNYGHYQIHATEILETTFLDHEKETILVNTNENQKANTKANEKELSVVTQKFELELEFVIPDQDNQSLRFTDFLNVFESFVKSTSKTEMICWTQNEIYHRAIALFNNCLLSIVNDVEDILNMKTPMIYESRPKNIKINSIHDNAHLDYAVTNKLDGQNFFLYFIEQLDNSKIYLINATECFLVHDHQIQTTKLDHQTTTDYPTQFHQTKLNNSIKLNSQLHTIFRQTILQGELLKNEFHVFDALVVNSIDISNCFHDKRISEASLFVSDLHKHHQINWVHLKKFYKSNTIEQSIMQTMNYMHTTHGSNCADRNDGLIFVPINEPYRNDKNFKYKFPNKMTIDFKLIELGANSNFISFSNTKPNTTANTNTTKNSNNNFENKNTFSYTLYILSKYENQVKLVPFTYPFGGKICTAQYQSDVQILSNSIAEFGFDQQTGKFVFHRFRNDKTKPNFSSIAEDVMQDILNPVSLSDICSYSSNSEKSLQNVDSSYSLNSSIQTINSSQILPTLLPLSNVIDRFRKNHNSCKRELIEKYCQNKNILDIGFGQGGDIRKYNFSNVGVVIGVEPNMQNFQQAYTRINQLQNKKTDFQLLCAQGQDYTVIGETVKNLPSCKVDVVCCFFSLNFFFVSENALDNLITTIDSCLKTDGHFIGTFMDGSRVKQYLNAKNTTHAKISGFFEFELFNKDDLQSPDGFNQILKISLGDNDTIVRNQSEGLLFKKILDTKLLEKNIEQIEYESITNNSENENADYKQFTSLYYRFAYRKTPKISIDFFSSTVNNTSANGADNLVFPSDVARLYTNIIEKAKKVAIIQSKLIQTGLKSEYVANVIDACRARKLILTKEKLIEHFNSILNGMPDIEIKQNNEFQSKKSEMFDTIDPLYFRNDLQL